MPNPSIKDLAYRGLASAIGGPVDLATMFLRPFGYGIPDKEVVGGSEWIGKKLETAGLIGSERSPVQEFLSSMFVPSPSNLAKGAALGGAALIKTGAAAKAITETSKMQAKINSATNPVKSGLIRLFHAGSDPAKGGVFETVPSGGVFDGFFALPNRYGAYGTGAKYYADIPENKVLNNYNLNYELPYDKVSKELESLSGIKRTDPRFDNLWASVVEDKAQDVINRSSDEDIVNLFKLSSYDNPGEAVWEAQRLRGRLAKKLGFDAVEMSDENGTSYLITSGTKLTRDVDDVVEKAIAEPKQSTWTPPKLEVIPDGYYKNRKGVLVKRQ